MKLVKNNSNHSLSSVCNPNVSWQQHANSCLPPSSSFRIRWGNDVRGMLSKVGFQDALGKLIRLILGEYSLQISPSTIIDLKVFGCKIWHKFTLLMRFFSKETCLLYHSQHIFFCNSVFPVYSLDFTVKLNF